jgi:hypothetical protein
MPSLHDKLKDPVARRTLVRDAAQVLDAEVADKGGISGLAIKAGYKLVQGVKPGFIDEAIDALLDDFVAALLPLAEEARAAGKPVGKHLEASASRVADALLGITDRRAQNARAALKGAYDRLRPTAKKQVEAAAPRLGGLLERHL